MAHSLLDHRLGAAPGVAHEHGDDSDHDHDHDDLGADASAAGPGDALWVQDNVILTSVGIDIGSAGTQVVFSRIHLQRVADQLSTRYVVMSREPLYQSPNLLTPYLSDKQIDSVALGTMIEQAYAAAGVHADGVDAGAVILTGEALRRDNAQAIAAVLAEQGGEFVCATAGHHMECMLAVYGSGAARRSFDAGSRILNIDIGGGTTKLGLVDKGELIATAAVHLGGRGVVVEVADLAEPSSVSESDSVTEPAERGLAVGAGRITRLDPAGRAHAARVGFDWQLGSVVTRAQMQRVAEGMADALLRIVQGLFSEQDFAELLLTDPLPELHNISGVMFSGGVGEYVYRREPRDFGDLGQLFGHAVRERLDAGALRWPLLPAGECLRATVLGASEYSVQLSGNTTFVSRPGALLPRKNLQVVPLNFALPEQIEPAAVAQALRQSLQRHDVQEGEQDNAISLRWSGPPSYARLSALADGILTALPKTLAQGRSLYVVADGDIALTLGHLFQDDERVTGEVLVIDGITLWGFDFIDLGRIRMPSLTVPVTIKSLVFSEDPRSHGKSDAGDWHQHGDGAMHHHRSGAVSGHDHGHGHGHGHGDHHAQAHHHSHSHSHHPEAATT